MTKISIISDIHGNLPAFKAVVKEIEEKSIMQAKKTNVPALEQYINELRTGAYNR